MKFIKLFFFSLLIYQLNACYSMINKGASLNPQNLVSWENRNSNVDRIVSLHNTCEGKDINALIVGYEYIAWIGPLFPVPFFPSIDSNIKKDIVVNLHYPYLNNNEIESCPAIQIDKDMLKKADKIEGKDMCYYSFNAPKYDFNLSFIGGNEACKLNQLNFKIKRYIKYDVWTFNG